MRLDVCLFGVEYLSLHNQKHGKYILVNYSDIQSLQPYHCKVIAIDTVHRFSPFPGLFIIHEMRVRGHNPFRPTRFDLTSIAWADWILQDGTILDDKVAFIHDLPETSGSNDGGAPSHSQPSSSLNPGNANSGDYTVELNDQVIADILAASRTMPTWRACQMEGTTWAGTAEENIKEYVSNIGVQDD